MTNNEKAHRLTMRVLMETSGSTSAIIALKPVLEAALDLRDYAYRYAQTGHDHEGLSDGCPACIARANVQDSIMVFDDLTAEHEGEKG